MCSQQSLITVGQKKTVLSVAQKVSAAKKVVLLISVIFWCNCTCTKMIELALFLDQHMFKNHIIFCHLIFFFPKVAMFVSICPEAE